MTQLLQHRQPRSKSPKFSKPDKIKAWLAGDLLRLLSNDVIFHLNNQQMHVIEVVLGGQHKYHNGDSG